MTMPDRLPTASANLAQAARFPNAAPAARADHDRMANAIRALAMDAVEQAKSGHPGLPMGAADIATVLFSRFLKFDPADPAWPDRDRFVLSAGHGSMLIYALLYLTGYEAMTIGEIKRFRQLGSLTPGHPEYGHTPGVETTTGPLGQGLANAVGMAIAERHLAALFGGDLVDHTTYVLASDGDLMEGISQEAIALAGHLKLNKLIVLFDDNGISIDGPLALTDSVDQVQRFEAAGWAATRIDGHDPAAIAAAIEAAKKSDRPSLIACRTTIGFGAPTKGGTEKSHGSALGADEIAARAQKLGWSAPAFEIPPAILAQWRAAGERGRTSRLAWQNRLAALEPQKRAEFERRIARRTRGGEARGGGARGEGKARGGAEGDRHPRRLRIRARSVDRGAAGNGRRLGRSDRLQQHAHQGDEGDERGGLFRPLHPLRRARARHGGGHERHGAARRHHSLFRHLPGVLRLLPAGHPARRADGPARHPCDDARLDRARRGRPDAPAGRASRRVARHPQPESVPAVRCGGDRRMLAAGAADHTGPSVLALTRQNVPQLRQGFDERNRCARGAYELIAAADGAAAVSLFATGSEVAIAVAAQKLLAARNIPARVVSVPCFELFLAAPDAERAAIIGKAKVNVAVEAGIRQGWDAIIGPAGAFVGMTGFGASAPYKELYQHFGLTPEKVVAAALQRLEAS